MGVDDGEIFSDLPVRTKVIAIQVSCRDYDQDIMCDVSLRSVSTWT